MVDISPDTSHLFFTWKKQLEEKYAQHHFIAHLFRLSEKIGVENWAAAETIINQLVLKCGAHPIAHWRLIQVDTAKAILTRILWKDLAYSRERMSLSTAKRLAADFLANFVPPMLYVTNGENLESNYSYDPITDATFDGGVIVFDGAKVGMLWVMDED
jgi:hypothetical protein